MTDCFLRTIFKLTAVSIWGQWVYIPSFLGYRPVGNLIVTVGGGKEGAGFIRYQGGGGLSGFEHLGRLSMARDHDRLATVR